MGEYITSYLCLLRRVHVLLVKIAAGRQIHLLKVWEDFVETRMKSFSSWQLQRNDVRGDSLHADVSVWEDVHR